jgi:hypothetical protein
VQVSSIKPTVTSSRMPGATSSTSAAGAVPGRLDDLAGEGLDLLDRGLFPAGHEDVNGLLAGQDGD